MCDPGLYPDYPDRERLIFAVRKVGRENIRLREALEKIADAGMYGCCNPMYPNTPPCSHNIARTAISEVEEEK